MKILHISHTRDSVNTSFIAGIDQIDFSKYEVLLLGGDLMEFSTGSWAQIELIDSMFDISSPNTLWTIGNHDNTSPSMISLVSGRPLHYAYNKDGITYLVLNSQENSCNIINSQ
ncbi:MAG: hypothetical protein HRT57_13850, partial [Crocinitomicaceae bacterium]|nr:hypothetical protein [Crocinitomicaceae bacterium]